METDSMQCIGKCNCNLAMNINQQPVDNMSNSKKPSLKTTSIRTFLMLQKLNIYPKQTAKEDYMKTIYLWHFTKQDETSYRANSDMLGFSQHACDRSLVAELVQRDISAERTVNSTDFVPSDG